MKQEITRDEIDLATKQFLSQGGKIKKLNNSVSLDDQIHEWKTKSDAEDKMQLQTISADQLN